MISADLTPPKEALNAQGAHAPKGKKSIYITQPVYEYNVMQGNTTFGSPDIRDQFRLDVGSMWDDTKLFDGDKGLYFKKVTTAEILPGDFQLYNGETYLPSLYDAIYVNKPMKVDSNSPFGTWRQVVKVGKFIPDADIGMQYLEEISNNIPNTVGDEELRASEMLNFRLKPGNSSWLNSVVVGNQMVGGTLNNFDETPESIIFNKLSGFNIGDYASIKVGVEYTDMTFRQDSPYTVPETDFFLFDNPSMQVGLDANYNYMDLPYEDFIFGSSDLGIMPEPVLPNMYTLVGSEYDSKQVITPKVKANFKGNTPKDFLRQYIEVYSPDNMSTDQRETYALRNHNIGITAKNSSYISDYNSKKHFFPMWGSIDLTMDPKTEFTSFMQEANLDRQLMKTFINSDASFNPETGEKQTTVRDDWVNLKAEVEYNPENQPINQNYLIHNRKLYELDFQAWLNSFEITGYSEFQSNVIKEQTTFIGTNYEENLKTDPSNSFYNKILSFMLKGQIKKNIVKNMRSFSELLEGKFAYSEVVMYRIDKHLTTDDGSINDIPIQRFYVTNKKDLDRITYYDTQVKFNKKYTYKITALTLVIGTSYTYQNLQAEMTYKKEGKLIPGEPQGEQWWYTFDVSYQPLIKIIEVPYYGFEPDENSTVTIYDNPPPRPEVQVVPVLGDRNKIKFWFNGGVDTYKEYPQEILDSDVEIYEKVRDYQKIPSSYPIRFSADDPAAQFQVFRIGPNKATGITPKPSAYEQFAPHYYFLVNGNNPQNSGAFTDILKLNTTYYYCFRTIDVHGNISSPSAVYEVKMAGEAGSDLSYPIVRVVDLKPAMPKSPTKSMRKFLYLRANQDQTFIDTDRAEELYDSANDAKQPWLEVGVKPDHLFANGGNGLDYGMKKFKVRLTSKSSGKKIDVNVRFLYKHSE